jgi:hypothetical protein
VTRLVRRALGGALGGVLGGAVAAALLAGILATAAPSSAAAAPCPPTTLAHDIKKADVVFRGVVSNVKPVRGTADQRTRNYRVEADRVYRGSLVTDSVTVTARVGTRCAAPLLAQDKRYLFFVTEKGSQLLATGATARATRALTDKLVAKLGDGAVPRPTPPATAEFTKVADASPATLSRLLAPGAALVIVSLLGLLVLGRVGRRHA